MELQFMMKIESSLTKDACVRLFQNNLNRGIYLFYPEKPEGSLKA